MLSGVKKTVSITIYGEADDKSSVWSSWINYVEALTAQLHYPSTHVSVRGDTFKSAKVTVFNRTKKRLLKALEKEEGFKWISFYSLPDDFKTAAFDYEILAARTANFVTLILSEAIFSQIDVDQVVEELKAFIVFREGEIYELDIEETPMIYATKCNSVSSFKTLKILHKL